MAVRICFSRACQIPGQPVRKFGPRKKSGRCEKKSGQAWIPVLEARLLGPPVSEQLLAILSAHGLQSQAERLRRAGVRTEQDLACISSPDDLPVSVPGTST